MLASSKIERFGCAGEWAHFHDYSLMILAIRPGVKQNLVA
jgi:hypothetical protein